MSAFSTLLWAVLGLGVVGLGVYALQTFGPALRERWALPGAKPAPAPAPAEADMPCEFEVRRYYETPWGSAKVLGVEPGGLTTFRLSRPSTRGMRAGFRRGHTFGLYLDDPVNPSPRTWSRLT